MVSDETVYRPLDLLSQLLVVVEDTTNTTTNNLSSRKNGGKHKNSHKGKTHSQPSQPVQQEQASGGGLVRVYTAGNKPSMWLLEQSSSSSSSEGQGQGQSSSSSGGGGGSDLLSVYEEEDDLCATLYSAAFALVVTVRQ